MLSQFPLCSVMCFKCGIAPDDNIRRHESLPASSSQKPHRALLQGRDNIPELLIQRLSVSVFQMYQTVVAARSGHTAAGLQGPVSQCRIMKLSEDC